MQNSFLTRVLSVVNNMFLFDLLNFNHHFPPTVDICILDHSDGLRGVEESVFFEHGQLCELFPTEVAGIHPIGRVGGDVRVLVPIPVPLHVSQLGKTVPADVADVGTFSSVNAHVCTHKGLPRKTLPTFRAFMVSDTSMDHLMLVQISARPENNFNI